MNRVARIFHRGQNMNSLPCILLVTDLSKCTREALADVAHMHQRWGTRIDAYYLWTNAPEVPSESPDRVMRELEAFSRTEGAWEVLDELGALDRAGLVTIRGYLTPSSSEPTLAEHASTYGYLGILYGTAAPPPSSQGFAIHGNLPSRDPGTRVRSIVAIASPQRRKPPRLTATPMSADAPRLGRIRSHAR